MSKGDDTLIELISQVRDQLKQKRNNNENNNPYSSAFDKLTEIKELFEQEKERERV